MKAFRRIVAGGILLALLAYVGFQIRMGLDFWPVKDAGDAIEAELEMRGYRMGGFLGDFVQQPDGIGGCEVRIHFYDQSPGHADRYVKVQARRSWVFGSWQISGLNEEQLLRSVK